MLKLSTGTALLVVLCLIFALGCSGDIPSFASSEVAPVDAPADSANPFASASDLSNFGNRDDTGMNTPAPDGGSFGWPECDEPGYAGCPCDENKDCLTGFCVPSPDGNICTETCVDSCPLGWTCTLIENTPPDVIYICLPIHTNLCRPCETGEDCIGMGGVGGYCVEVSPAEGSFCSAPCSENQPCPKGYACNTFDDLAPESVTQCWPESDECSCTALAIQQGATTPCSVENDGQICDGERECGPEGLTQCSASAPEAEICDGLDNNCNEEVDEGACPPDRVCTCDGGECACGCPPGLVECGDECVDIQSSVAHCGQCDHPCEADHVTAYVCTDGVCGIAKCEAGFEDVDSAFDTGCECPLSDEICDGQDNDCNGVVDDGELCAGDGICAGQCIDGGCQCPAGCDACANTCIPLEAYASDVNNCGYCGHGCQLVNTAIHICEAGLCCPVVCLDGFKDCNGDCGDGCEWTVETEICDGVDNDCDGGLDEEPLSDCTAPKTCVSGLCICDTSLPYLQMCDGENCIDTNTSVEHCGACDNDCNDLALDNVAAYTCVDGICQIAQCAPPFVDTDEQPFNGCECEQTAAVEVCDGVDNDCDGAIDNHTQPCTTACGGGLETCVAGAWEGCTAQPPTTCLDFATCTDQAICVDVCPLAPPDICNGIDDNCDSNIDEGFTCAPGNEMAQPCGNCGQQIFACNETCDWEPVGGCTDGACTPGEVDTQTCGNCGTQTRPCTELCLWGEWNECTGQGECAVAEVDTQGCGNCGAQTRTCTGACSWEAWGACGAEGACAPGTNETQTCGACGTQTRTCSDGCGWSGWSVCAGEGVCFSGAQDTQPCGDCGAQTRTCTAQCSWPDWGACGGEGQCTIGEQETQACGTCGSQTRDCQGDCSWSGWAVCQSQAVCTPGETETMACGNCGSSIRTCTDGCQWGDWSGCNGEGVCTPGQGDSQSCGSCGNQSRTCTDQCGWGGWGGCGGQGECTAGAVDTQGCGLCGQETRTCSGQCAWSGWSGCGGQGECTPGDSQNQGCGACGQQTQTCNSQCAWSGWGICQGQGECTAGSTDQQSCGLCGQQARTCSGQCAWGGWSGCSGQGMCPPGDFQQQNCGLCGTQSQTCSSQCNWPGWGSCQGQGECVPGDVQTQGCGACGSQSRTCTSQCTWGGWSGCGGQGQCTPGDSQEQGCGQCGSQTRSCSSQCTWGGWSGCGGQGQCSPGTVDSQGCGDCGNQTRTCTNQCSWPGWGTCSGQGVCSPGDSNTQSCGNCGSQTRHCTGSCSWGSFGSCFGQGACSAGDSQSQACGNCGTQYRSCSSSCGWGSWGSCGGQGACSPYTSSSCADEYACGAKTCSGSCAYGSCAFTKDSHEPNENWGQATPLGGYSEGNTISAITNAWLHQNEPGFPGVSPGEIDRFWFSAYESGSPFDWGMSIDVTVSSITGWHMLCIYYDRGFNNSIDKTACVSGYGTLTASTGDVDSNDGGNDDGWVDVELYGDWSCASYTLQIGID